MYFIYCDKLNNTKYKNEIKQFGLKFYSIKEKQKSHIKEVYCNIYNSKEKINRAIIKQEDGTFRFNIDKRKELMQNPNLSLIVEIMRFEKIKPIFHKNIDNFLDNIIVLEINEEKLSKYIEKRDFRIFINQFIDFHYIYDPNTKSQIKSKDIILPYDIRKIHQRDENPTYDKLVEEILIKYLFNFHKISSYGCFYAEESFIKYLSAISKFTESISSNELFKFIEILEIFYSNARLSQNNILNDTLIIESLLVKKESDFISREFVLKTGIIYKDSNFKKYYTNEDLTAILTYVYNIRSAIIHGSLDGIFSCYNSLSQKVKSFTCPRFENMSKMDKKIEILQFTEEISYEFVKIVLLYWINYNDKITFLKNN